MIVIVDYKLGNLGSIKNMLNKIGIEAMISSKYEDVISATKIILPGVGSFDNGMKNLNDLNLVEALNQAVLLNKTPILGICLGMQIMGKSSDEGNLKGLSWIDLNVKSFKDLKNFTGTIPVMGWNYVNANKENPILNNNFSRFYFVHKYYFEQNKYQILNSDINGLSYCAAFQKENIFGVQFHPEKSHKFGMKLLHKFCSI
jgi:imidazole glycerol-phosphate synthase subunit HisH